MWCTAGWVFGRLGAQAVVFGFGAWVYGMVYLDVHLLKAGKGVRLFVQGMTPSWYNLCGVRIVLWSCGKSPSKEKILHWDRQNCGG